MSRESSNPPSDSSQAAAHFAPPADPCNPRLRVSSAPRRPSPRPRPGQKKAALAACPLCELAALATAPVLRSLPTAASGRRSQRVDRLERLCRKILAKVAGGQPVSTACRDVGKAARRRLPGNSRSGASAQNLQKLFTRWVASGWQRAALCDRFGANRKAHESLAAYFAAVAMRPGIGNLRAAYRIVVAAWKRGTTLPGLGSWLPYPRCRGMNRKFRASPPPFPITYAALIRYFPRSDLQAFREQRAKVERARLQARASLRLSRHHLAALRARLAARAAQRGEGTNS